VGGQRPSKKTVVLPGEEIELGTLSAGTGTFSENGKTYAQILGLKIEYRGTVSVVPLSGIYAARQGDTIIANVIDLGPSNWTLDLRASQPSSMHVNDVPWKVDFGDTSRYIDVGETVLCKVLKVDEVKRVFITLNGAGLRKLEGGEVIEIPHTKVGRVVGKGGATLDKLKKWTSCRIIAAANGRVWVDGEMADMGVAIAAIRLIVREADSPNLSERVDAFLKEHGREPKPEAQVTAGFGTDDGSKPPAPSDEADEAKEAEKREKAAKEEE
jgi:exosome complex component RRP4